MGYGFELVLPVPEAEPDVLGVWRAAAGGSSFGAAAGGDRPAVLWRAELPGPPLAASSLMAGQERLLAAAGLALPDAGRRLQRFVADSRPAGSHSFALDSAALPEPERELAILLGEARTSASSFAVEDKMAGIRQLAGEAGRFLEQVQETLRHYAQVETVQEGVLLARTTVGWLGDVQSEALRAIRPDQAALHRRSVALALETRASWIRVVAQMGQGVLLLGGGVISANPLMAAAGAWKFIRSILAEWQRLKAAAPA